MTGLNHAATGAMVAVVIGRPILALPLALLSHFVVDGLPHWDYRVTGQKRRIIMRTDLAASIVLLFLLAYIVGSPGWLVISCGLLCMLPDAMWLPAILYGKPTIIDAKTSLGRLRQLHRKIQWSESPKGLYFEALWLAATLTLTFYLGT